MRHGLSFDVECYRQIHWRQFLGANPPPSRDAEHATQTVLDLLATHGVRATFFVVGSLSREYPWLVRRIVSEGHELGSHGDEHRDVRGLDARTFREELVRSKQTLEDLTGVEVVGHRAPMFSLTEALPFAVEALARTGFVYDSSVFPFEGPRYGQPDAPLGIYRLRSGVMEYPAHRRRNRWTARAGARRRLLQVGSVRLHAMGAREAHGRGNPRCLLLSPVGVLVAVDSPQPQRPDLLPARCRSPVALFAGEATVSGSVHALQARPDVVGACVWPPGRDVIGRGRSAHRDPGGRRATSGRCGMIADILATAAQARVPTVIDRFNDGPLRASLEFLAPALGHGAAVLDIGCGGGALTEAMSARGIRAYGLDVDVGVLRGRGRRARPASGSYVAGTAERLPFAGGTFDAIVSVSVLQYTDWRGVLGECRRVLKPRGRAAFLENLRGHPLARAYRIVRRKVWPYQRFLTPRGHIDWSETAEFEAIFPSVELSSYHLLTPWLLIPHALRDRRPARFSGPGDWSFDALHRCDERLLRRFKAAQKYGWLFTAHCCKA